PRCGRVRRHVDPEGRRGPQRLDVLRRRARCAVRRRHHRRDPPVPAGRAERRRSALGNSVDVLERQRREPARLAREAPLARRARARGGHRVSATISAIDTRLVRIPLSRPWGADVTEIHVIEVMVTDSEGSTGFGFSWTPTIGAHAVHQRLAHDITGFALGKPADPQIWKSAWTHLHEAGGGGITTIALAGLDRALWDLHARRAGQSITDFIGRKHTSLPAYGSG